MKIDHENASRRHAAQLTQDSYHFPVSKMVREERTDRVIELIVSKGESEGVATRRGDFRKLT